MPGAALSESSGCCAQAPCQAQHRALQSPAALQAGTPLGWERSQCPTAALGTCTEPGGQQRGHRASTVPAHSDIRQ